MKINFANFKFSAFIIGEKPLKGMNIKPVDGFDMQISTKTYQQQSDTIKRNAQIMLRLADNQKAAYTYIPYKNSFITIRKNDDRTLDIKSTTYSNCNSVFYSFDKNAKLYKALERNDKNETDTIYYYDSKQKLKTVEIRRTIPNYIKRYSEEFIPEIMAKIDYSNKKVPIITYYRYKC